MHNVLHTVDVLSRDVKFYALKLQSGAFFGLKIIQNTYLSKYITSQHSKLSACLSSIQSSKLVIIVIKLQWY